MTIKTLEYIHNLLIDKVKLLQREYNTFEGDLCSASFNDNYIHLSSIKEYKAQKLKEAREVLNEFEKENWK